VSNSIGPGVLSGFVNYSSLGSAAERLAKSIEKLSSGQRINRAATDTAGLAISSLMGADLKGLTQGIANISDGLSMIEIADNALGSTSDQLLRMRELAVAAANGTLSSGQRSVIQKEFASIAAEVDRVAGSTEFNGHRLLDGSAGAVEIVVGQAGDGAIDSVSVDLSANMDATSLGVRADLLSGQGGEAARAALGDIERALTRVSTRRAAIGGSANRLSSAQEVLANTAENIASARSRITDTDYAAAVAGMVSAQMQAQAGLAVLAQGQQLPASVATLLPPE